MKTKALLFLLTCVFSCKMYAQSCPCLIPVDSTFHIVPFTNGSAPEYRNDDGYTTAIPLPFNFSFYNNTYNSVYINNNGNISFGTAYSTFTSNAFPDPGYVMVAPFWSDVDTRSNGSGLVYYKITPTALIVRWEQVGYFNSHVDKRNDFQLIITDGSNADFPNNYNVQFCYGDMQWTTGDASSGVNGFGGTPATVGVNLGNGTDFWQVGRFDHDGTDFDGPNDNADGVSWLDNKMFYANTSYSPDTSDPLIISTNLCDTILAPVYSPQGFNFFVMPGIGGSNISLTIDTSNISGFSYQILPGSGNSYTVQGTFMGQISHPGLNELVINVNYSAFARSSAKQYKYYYFVEHCPLTLDSLEISGTYTINDTDTVICINSPNTFHVLNDNYQYYWLNNHTFSNTYTLQPFASSDSIVILQIAVIDTASGCSTIKTFAMHTQICEGLNETALKTIVLYPNPVADNLTWTAGISSGVIEIYNTIGQKMYSQKITGSTQVIPLNGLSGGIYYLKTISDFGTSVMQFVKLAN